MKVELFAGPRDGELVEIPDPRNAPEILRFPMDHDTFLAMKITAWEQETMPPIDEPLRIARYRYWGRRAGRPVYQWDGEDSTL